MPDDAWMLDGSGSLVLTSLTPLSLLPLNFDDDDFFFLAFFDFFDEDVDDDNKLDLVPEEPPALTGTSSKSETCSSSAELLAT